MHFKDEILDELANRANVAQFVSLDPDAEIRFSRVSGLERNHGFESITEAIGTLLERTVERSVNVRSYDPADPKSREFVYGITSRDDAVQHVRRLAASGLHTIVNETIDIGDGGVSGVALGDLIEFAPDDTPRCVEKPGTAALPRALGIALLEIVYGSAPLLDYLPTTRVEFSIHPLRCGVRNQHTIIWELEDVGASDVAADIRWPNRFSQHIGDKAYGLLIAHLVGLPVPRATVISRRVAPFTFGRATGTSEPWIRTCPTVQTPGKFTTHRGWLDPYALLDREDPNGTAIASILCQEGVDASHSGAAIGAESADGPLVTIEGTSGFGDEFMVGLKARSALPPLVRRSVQRLYGKAFDRLGYVRFEWVAGSRQTWVVQLHRGASPSSGRIIFPGEVVEYVPFEVSLGLEALRSLTAQLIETDKGVALVGDVGITSHFGDVLRKARLPSVISDEVF